MKISNIRVKEYVERIEVPCPNCGYINYYNVHASAKFEAVRPCHNCPAILIFEVENVAD